MNEDQKKAIKEFSVKEHALNKDKLGSLTFDESYKYFEELQKLFTEVIDLDYERKLSPSEVIDINNLGVQFLDHHLNRLRDYNINQDNAKGIHDSIESDVTNFHNDVSRRFRPSLTYLRQEAGLESQSAKDLQEERRETIKAKKEYKKLISDFNLKFEELTKREKEVKIKSGEVAVKELAHHFDQQADDYIKEARGEQPNFSKIKGQYKWYEKPLKWGEKQWIKMKTNGGWLRIRKRFYWLLMFIIVANFILYLVVKFWVVKMQVGDIFTLEYGLVKIALISLLYYGMHFAARNYYISSNLAAINKHRKNVAQTFEDFLNTDPDKEVLSQMTKQGTEAMFRHFSSGYLSKTEKQEEGFVNQIINRLPFNKDQ